MRHKLQHKGYNNNLDYLGRCQQMAKSSKIWSTFLLIKKSLQTLMKMPLKASLGKKTTVNCGNKQKTLVDISSQKMSLHKLM